MGCTNCAKRRRDYMKYARSVQSPQIATSTSGCPNLSAPRLTSKGYIRTCTKCGNQSKPSPFPDQIEIVCPDETVNN